MGGFAGFVDAVPKRSAAELEALARGMSDALAHRGPDDADAWVDEAVGLALAHRRLAVLDPSPAGRQPMVSASWRHRLVYDGELYNFADLRKELEGGGATFRGGSDTEVLLAAIEAWGLVGALQRVVGVHAFALWDSQDRVLHLVRDRLGERPLYHGWQGNSFVFASELKALRRHPSWDGAIDRQALAAFVRLGYVPAPWSIHAGIQALPPGTVLSLSHAKLAGGFAATARVEPSPYWSVIGAARRGIVNPFLGGEAEAVQQVDLVLRDAVRRRMTADVPVGALLSGGVASSAVVALMQVQSQRPIPTFAVALGAGDADGDGHVRAVAQLLGTEHAEMRVAPEEAMAVIPDLPGIYDEPFADPSQVTACLVARLAGRHVKVALAGDGGDELFGGHGRTSWTRRFWATAGRLPIGLRRALAAAALAVPERTWAAMLRLVPFASLARRPDAGARLHRLAALSRLRDPRQTYLRLVSSWPDPTAVVLGAGEAGTVLTEPGEQLPWRDLIEELSYLDLALGLPGSVLVKVDRACMAASLEPRLPLLDHGVVEMAWRFPPSIKLRSGRGNWLLRQVVARYLPPRLADGARTTSGVPIGSWLRGPLRRWAEDLLHAGRMQRQGYLAPGPVWSAWERHLAGTGADDARTWHVLVFQAWLARWTR